MRKMRIEISGGIASGKTTLAKLLALNDEHAFLEHFKSNPFWSKFYSDPKRYAFETEITFHLQHYSQFKDAEEVSGVNFCDTSFLLDLAYADLNLYDQEYETFLNVYKHVQKSISPPSAIIHLICPAEVQLNRVRRRARDEEASITVDYLDGLNNALFCRMEEIQKKVHVIQLNSGELNFADNDEDKMRVKSTIQERLESIK